jgi:hypothetical protein
MAKASRKFTPAPAESTPTPVEPAPAPAAGNLIDAGKITIVGKSGSKVEPRHYRPMDITDWGRPSPRDDYRQEAERRLKDGEVSPEMTHKEFANDLRDWFINKWPERKPPAARTIENNTVDLWRRYERG